MYSVLNEYYGNNGQIHYNIGLTFPINDTNPLPANGCTLESADTSKIYADGSGYNACLDDSQLQAEVNSVTAQHGLAHNLNHIYVLYLPKQVESCFTAGSDDLGRPQRAGLHDQLRADCGLLRLPQRGSGQRGVREPGLPDL